MSEIIIDKSEKIQTLAENVDRLATDLDNQLYALFREAKDITKDYNNSWVIPNTFTLALQIAVNIESELAQCTVEWLNTRKRSSNPKT
jgi:predicted ATP-dependent protease